MKIKTGHHVPLVPDIRILPKCAITADFQEVKDKHLAVMKASRISCSHHNNKLIFMNHYVIYQNAGDILKRNYKKNSWMLQNVQ